MNTIKKGIRFVAYFHLVFVVITGLFLISSLVYSASVVVGDTTVQKRAIIEKIVVDTTYDQEEDCKFRVTLNYRVDGRLDSNGNVYIPFSSFCKEKEALDSLLNSSELDVYCSGDKCGVEMDTTIFSVYLMVYIIAPFICFMMIAFTGGAKGNFFSEIFKMSARSFVALIKLFRR